MTDHSGVSLADDFVFPQKTDTECSLVCRRERIPANAYQTEAGFGMMRVAGTLDFSLTGILACIAQALAGENISIFAVSTYDTDYILVKQSCYERAVGIAQQALNRLTAQ